MRQRSVLWFPRKPDATALVILAPWLRTARVSDSRHTENIIDTRRLIV